MFSKSYSKVKALFAKRNDQTALVVGEYYDNDVERGVNPGYIPPDNNYFEMEEIKTTSQAANQLDEEEEVVTASFTTEKATIYVSTHKRGPAKQVCLPKLEATLDCVDDCVPATGRLIKQAWDHLLTFLIIACKLLGILCLGAGALLLKVLSFVSRVLRAIPWIKVAWWSVIPIPFLGAAAIQFLLMWFHEPVIKGLGGTLGTYGHILVWAVSLWLCLVSFCMHRCYIRCHHDRAPRLRWQGEGWMRFVVEGDTSSSDSDSD